MWQSVRQRCMSTTTNALKQGSYGPGFSPPKGSRDTIKTVKKRRVIATSLPSHLGNPESKERSANSPQQTFREEMRSRRQQYAQELLQKYGQRQAAAAEKLAKHKEQTAGIQAMLAKEKEDQIAHEQEVLSKLEMDSLNGEQVEDNALKREARRTANRLEHERADQIARQKMLVKLYKSTESFVTLDNLDSKVDEMLSTPHRPYTLSMSDLLNSPVMEQWEIERRKELIKEAMSL